MLPYTFQNPSSHSQNLSVFLLWIRTFPSSRLSLRTGVGEMVPCNTGSPSVTPSLTQTLSLCLLLHSAKMSVPFPRGLAPSFLFILILLDKDHVFSSLDLPTLRSPVQNIHLELPVCVGSMPVPQRTRGFSASVNSIPPLLLLLHIMALLTTGHCSRCFTQMSSSLSVPALRAWLMINGRERTSVLSIRAFEKKNFDL